MEKNTTGRQLARISALNYHETVRSELFAGNRNPASYLQPIVQAVETGLELEPHARRHTVYRLDGGAGTDAQLRWVLARDYQVVAKGFSGTIPFRYSLLDKIIFSPDTKS